MGNGKVIFIFVLVAQLALGQTKTEMKEIQYENIKELVTSGKFVFVADRAIPRGGANISLSTNANYLKVVGDSSVAHMPFFGERFSGGGFGEPGAIQFQDKMEGHTVEYNDRKGRTTIKFSARNKYDRYGVILEVSRSGWANLLIRSIDRSTINYYGQLRPLTREEYGK